jgi:peroxiredoxin
MKLVRILFSLFSLTLLLTACEGGSEEVNIQGTVSGCQAGSLSIYTLEGNSLKTLTTLPLGSDGSLDTDVKLASDGFYWIGSTQRDIRTLVLVQGESLTLNGQCGAMAQAQVSNSPSNEAFISLNQSFTRLQQSYDNLLRQVMMRPQSLNAQTRQQLNQLYSQMQQMVDSVKQTQPLFAKALAVGVAAPPPPESGNSDPKAGFDHYAGQYLPLADLSDPSYDHLPMLADQAGQFVLSLTQFFPDDPESVEQYLDKLLARFPENSLAWRNVLARTINMLEQSRFRGYETYARRYMAQYPTDPGVNRMQQVIPAIAQYYKQKDELDKQFAIGKEPPEIALPNPEGKILKLSDLRGQVVLIDFWASWCGPCRRENPNVKRVYDQYRDKGFEILGVSLDRDRGKWLKAIEDDGLEWLHVSDLKFWQSAAAQAYQVSAIPKTFLIGRDGKILGKDLRGPSLEQKLAEVFSES